MISITDITKNIKNLDNSNNIYAYDNNENNPRLLLF